jgi:flagella basal body P-ring formation protein FlgA
MYGNGRPLGMRKRVQVAIAVVLLAWATQTLIHQWGFGAEIPTTEAAEKFVPGADRMDAGATLELRGEATVYGSEVKLRQICRWSDTNTAMFAPVADLVVTRVRSHSPFRAISVEEVRQTLQEAGMNMAAVKFAGPISCTISRSDANYDEQTALRLWAEAKGEGDGESGRGDDAEKEDVKPQSAAISATASPPRPLAPSLTSAPEDLHTLRSLLIDDLSIRLGIAKDQLQVTFSPSDEKLLSMAEPLFKFDIKPRHVRDLGEVSWDVVVLTGKENQKGVVTANARAWQNEVVLARPVTYRQVIQNDDVAERRVLTDRLPGDQLLSAQQIVGQEAGRDLQVGTLVNARMVQAVPMVKPGQLVTMTVTVGSVRIKTVGRALEIGCYGQVVKVKNDTTGDTFDVVMTGPQQGSMDPLPAVISSSPLPALSRAN